MRAFTCPLCQSSRREDISHRWVVWALMYPDEADEAMRRDWNEQENDDEDAERYLDGIEDPDAD